MSNNPEHHRASRRDFLKTAVSLPAAARAQGNSDPWYRRTYCWGQANITERHPARYEIGWWREYRKRV